MLSSSAWSRESSRNHMISEATVSRFARHAGFDDFKSLKQAIIDSNLGNGAVVKLTNTIKSSSGQLLEDFLTKQAENIARTVNLLDENESEKAILSLLDARTVYIHGKNASYPLASLLVWRLRRLSVDVRSIPSSGSEVVEGVAGARRGDVFFLFSFSKLSAETSWLLEHARKEGITSIMMTSRLYSQHSADITLYVSRGQEDEFHSQSAPCALIDALIVALSSRQGAKAIDSLSRIRKLKESFRENL